MIRAEVAISSSLPHGWCEATLEQISELIFGQSPPSSTYNGVRQGLPFYQGKLDFGEIYPTPRKWCTSPQKIAEKGDVLISIRAPVGPTNLCPEKSCIGRDLAAIRPLGGISPKFVLYLLRANERVIAGKGIGTTISGITSPLLRKFSFWLPPLNEQKRIVSKIEELFTKLDAGIEYLKKARIELKRYKQSVLKAGFEGRLTQNWREQHKTEIESDGQILEQFLTEKCKDRKLSEETQVELPIKWRWVKIGLACQELIGGGTPSRERPEYFGGSIVWLTPTEIDKESIHVIQDSKEKLTESGFDNSSVRIIPRGSVLLSSRATIGSVAIAGCELTTNQGFASFVCSSVLHNFYLAYWLWANKDMLQNSAKGTTFKEISKTMLRAISIPVPPLCEQLEIARELDRVFILCEHIDEAIEKDLGASSILRQSILNWAFQGRLVPQNPDDEPARSLLVRIMEQRSRLAVKSVEAEAG